MSAANRACANRDLDAANRLNPMGCEAFCVASDRLMRRFASFCGGAQPRRIAHLDETIETGSKR